MYKQLLNNEDFTSIQEAQAGLSRLLVIAAKKDKFYRVMKNNKPLGVLIPDKMWDSLLEDLEALSSRGYQEEIAKARMSGRRYSAKEVKKELGL